MKTFTATKWAPEAWAHVDVRIMKCSMVPDVWHEIYALVQHNVKYFD